MYSLEVGEGKDVWETDKAIFLCFKCWSGAKEEKPWGAKDWKTLLPTADPPESPAQACAGAVCIEFEIKISVYTDF